MKINDFHIQLLSKRYTCRRHIPRVGVEVNINVKSYLVYKFKSHFYCKITIAVAMAQLYCRVPRRARILNKSNDAKAIVQLTNTRG